MTNNPYRPLPPSATDSQARERYIVGSPPRLAPLAPEDRTDQQQQWLDDNSGLVVDGEFRPRQDIASVEILVRHRSLYDAHVEVSQRLLTGCDLSIRERELAILRIGWLSQAPFEWASHVKIAKENGFTTEEIERVIEGSSAAGWNDPERAILRAMEELHFDSMITDETWDSLAETLTDRQLIELTILAGQYKTVAYLQNTLRLPLHPNKEGLSAR